MRYAKIRTRDVTNGKGIVCSLFVQGCHFHCNGCWNESTWDFQGGKLWTKDVEDRLINDLCSDTHIKGLSILGGEPLAYENFDDVLRICKRFKEVHPDKNLYLWSGYTFETIKGTEREAILQYLDVLIDGRFDITKRDLMLYLRGSSNQRVIDVKRSIEEDKVVIHEDYK